MSSEADPGPGDGRRPSSRRARALLALGAGAGIALAAAQLLVSSPVRDGALPSGAVASVNGVPVRLEEFERALAGLEADRRGEMGEAERRFVLDRLVEEELLVQRALELGLARHDRRVRGDLVSTLIQAVVAEATQGEPTAREVETFFEENRDYFRRPGRLRVRQLLVRSDGERAAETARARARAAAQRLAAGEPFDSVAAELGDPALPELPDALLAPTKLREYLGPTATRAALDLEVGAVSEPVRSSAGFRVLELVEREGDRTPRLEEIEDEVRAELRRRAGDRALRAYLEELRERAEVRVAETLP